ncbi:tRNA (adenosine(37)-N6)-threonylcarbamoyltransferase complex transferase subunit TsaD [Alkaliphilus serpentinus]|uniref:N(6)-L-threonylcarbamoyladenine synthase n=1 Tax=Alkaliphilus serpentinus TaxID=1482731 RepID=A0A833HM88_9FIRM|nr:O-sialoglycoprotein endopeptidase [Alkaliphilus serpentinus]KAB3527569.1 O-sialoglycoprotein endopeptidase [Alkaliphilus serpentinus]
MNKEGYVLGIDTSNYTTSIAVLDLEGKLVADSRILLSVRVGDVGLRQSEALFQHIKNLPNIMEELKSKIPGKIVAIASATAPRPVEGSYMPVFMAAKSYGQACSALLGVPFFEFSHQEGHIEAGLWSLKTAINEEFIALHISGGTTELLRVLPNGVGYEIDIIGGTTDLSAGQFIDRIGVKLGLPFPSGPALENLAKEWKGEAIKLPASVKGSEISFSGPETHLQRSLDAFSSKEELAYSLFESIGKSLATLLTNTWMQNSYRDLLIVGGVAANNQIRAILTESLRPKGIYTHLSIPRYSSDNAVGIAAFALKKVIDGKIF